MAWFADSRPAPLTHERVGLVLAGTALLAGVLLSWLVSSLFLLLVAGTALNLVISGLTDRCLVKRLLIRLGLPGERDVGRAEAIMKPGVTSLEIPAGRIVRRPTRWSATTN